MKRSTMTLKLKLIAAVILLPLFGHANMTVRNQTPYIAQYVIKKGDMVIARLPGIAPDAQMLIPTDSTYEVTASAFINGNTYTSAPLAVTGPMGFLAQVVQNPSQGTYEFNVVEIPTSKPNALIFEKTCLSPVVFTISKDGRPVQNVVVNNSFETQELFIDDVYYIYAVINGVTTDVYTTTNPNATITATVDHSDLGPGYFSLVID
ncbi:hypothetical protein ACNH6C_17545 [Bdellovibrio bacteriovorus]|uniref:hypothetical protein n=1 Tax=Bdellovibrio bacteriovorus TaxID=959 RepID=UPI0035A6516B